ncbi:hypothetical protein JNJ66_03740 [Candidatus Saccharibacteria bacterium]|nr:hypothetical protein [Candidatus Saccharibacteria bacterium]
MHRLQLLLLLLVVTLGCSSATAPGQPTPAGAGSQSSFAYPVHSGIKATIFWAGEPATPANDHIANFASAWDPLWSEHFGGFDDPNNRQNNGYWPAGFRPHENPFYAALPVFEFDEEARVRPEVSQIYWYDPAQPPQWSGPPRSILKNRWIEVELSGRKVYVQLQDVGPFELYDYRYVFGDRPPADRRAGLDLAPAAVSFLTGRQADLSNWSALVSWRFVDRSQVPPGPWLDIVTTREMRS